MTDIWDEKPKLVDAMWYDQVGENLPDSNRYYINKEEYGKAMDAWLDNLKAHQTDLEKGIILKDEAIKNVKELWRRQRNKWFPFSVLTNIVVLAIGYPRGWVFGRWFIGFCLVSALFWNTLFQINQEAWEG